MCQTESSQRSPSPPSSTFLPLRHVCPIPRAPARFSRDLAFLGSCPLGKEGGVGSGRVSVTCWMCEDSIEEIAGFVRFHILLESGS